MNFKDHRPRRCSRELFAICLHLNVPLNVTFLRFIADLRPGCLFSGPCQFPAHFSEFFEGVENNFFATTICPTHNAKELCKPLRSTTETITLQQNANNRVTAEWHTLLIIVLSGKSLLCLWPTLPAKFMWCDHALYLCNCYLNAKPGIATIPIFACRKSNSLNFQQCIFSCVHLSLTTAGASLFFRRISVEYTAQNLKAISLIKTARAIGKKHNALLSKYAQGYWPNLHDYWPYHDWHGVSIGNAYVCGVFGGHFLAANVIFCNAWNTWIS